MEKLIERYKREKDKLDILPFVEIVVWDKGCDLICCTKGLYVFLEQNQDDVMYEQLCILLERVT